MNTARDGNAAPRSFAGRCNRVWRCAWRITAGLFVILFVTLLAFSFDDELLDTSALRYEPRQIPDAENAYLVVAAAAKDLGYADDLEFSRLLGAIRGNAWDDSEVDEWLDGREHASEAIRTIRLFQNAQAPVAGNVDGTLTEQPRLDLVGALTALEIRRLHRDGRQEAALSLTLDAMHAARLLGKSRGDMVHHIYAFQMEEATLEAVVHLVSEPKTPFANLKRLQEVLSTYRPLREEFVQALAADYRRCEALVDAYENQDRLPSTWRSAAPRNYFLPYRLPFLFKPNQTLNYAIPFYLFSVTAIDSSSSERETDAAATQHTRVDLCAQYDDLDNAWGKRLAHDGLLPSLDSFLDARLRQQTRISLAETLIALRLYHDANDREFPASLAALVPAYLPAVPRDYFDGEPIKYSPELRAIWSAGPEGDFRLTDASRAVDERELILPLCFDGSYFPWPRRDPNARPRYFDEDESGELSQNPPHNTAN
jgi:hypothetical protein